MGDSWHTLCILFLVFDVISSIPPPSYSVTKPGVHYVDADGRTTTSGYVRPISSPLIAMEEFDMAHAHRRNAGACGGAHPCSEQVHLALGGPGEMTVSFANLDPHVEATVAWGDSPSSLKNTATGSSQAHSFMSHERE